MSGSVWGQTVYFTSSGGSYPGEKWINITTGANGTGTQVWGQGNGVIGNGSGLLTDEAIDISAFCGQTLYLNAYDSYSDSWDGTIYTLEETTSGPVIINNSGNSPDDGSGSGGSGSWGLETSESFSVPCPCTIPTAVFNVVANCPTDFSIDVNVTTNDATGVDISDDDATTSHSFTNAQDGISTMGPYALGTDVIITVAGIGCTSTINSSTFTELCACTTIPTATVSALAPDCGAGIFDIEVTIDSDGDGDANMSDIYVDGLVEMADVMTGSTVAINKPVGSYNITIVAEGASFVTCESIAYPVSATCTNFTCPTAFNVPLDGSLISSSPLPNSSTTYEPLSCDGSGNEETWFAFSAPNSGVVSLDVSNYDDPFTNLEWGLFSGACGSLSEVDCGAGNTATPIVGLGFSGLTPGSTYYLQFSQDTGGGENFDVSMTSPVSDITANTQTCWDLNGAPNIVEIGPSTSYDYNCSSVPSSSWSGTTDSQVGFIYTPTANETVDFVLDNVVDNSGDEFFFGVFDNTTGTPVSCTAGLASMVDATLTAVSLTGGVSYLIIIGGRDNTTDTQGCLTIKQQCNTVSVPTVTPNCAGGTYSVDLSFSSLGIATTVDITDGTTTYTGIATGTPYTFNFTDVGAQTITITGYDAMSNVTCSEDIEVSSGCNGADAFSITAPDITNACSPGDLSMATAGTAVGFYSSCVSGGVSSGDVGNNVIRECPAGFDNNTNWVDLWYQVDLPDGTDEMTLSITGLGTGEILGYTLHTADPGTNASNNPVSSTNDFDCSFFDSAVTSHTIEGLADESTAPIYIRILGIAVNDSDCSTIATPSFTICTIVPQPNDVCNDAINITTNNLDDTGVASIGNLMTASDEGNSIDCAGTSVTGADLWYEVLYPDVPSVIQTFFTELSLTGAAGDQYIINVFDVTSACGSAGDPADMEHCELITLTGGTDVTTLGNITSTDGQSREVQIIAVNATAPVTVEATVVNENNTCSHFQNVLPGYDITSAQPVDFNYSTDSGADPVTAGNDLWFQFSPNQANDQFMITASTSADVTVSGLTGDQEITILTYLGNGLSADNCTDLAGDYLSSVTIDNDGTIVQAISCLDETHLSTDGGYLIRVVQTAGSTVANPTVTITPSPPGPSNNSPENICSGTGPRIGAADNPNTDAAHDWNPYWIFSGETVTSSFVGANDCELDATCNGVDFEAIQEVNDRDLWYVFEVPNNQCATLGLTQSTVVSSMGITYDADNQFHDGVAYVYDACDTSTPLDCSGSLDGEGETWTVNDLVQGEFYLLRVKPWDISSTPTDWSFDISVDNGLVSPCNDFVENAEGLTVNTGCSSLPWYPALETFSALGANDEETFGQNDVFFKFTAPLPANGGAYNPQANATYAGLEKSWVTVFLENVSGHIIQMELWNTQTIVATATQYTTSSTAGNKIWARFGNLEPGAEYEIRLYHGEIVTTDVQYKIRVEAGDNVTSTTECDAGDIAATPVLCGSCGGEDSVPYLTDPVVSSLNSSGDNNHCETWYKVDLPELAGGSGTYWAVEVRGEEQVLDFELRQQIATESLTHGTQEDFDHPCSSRQLSSSMGTLISSIPVSYEVTPGPTYSAIMLNDMGGGESVCQCVTGCSAEEATSKGGGFRKIYRDLLGPAPGQKNYLYIRVFMDEDDPAYMDCHDGGVLIDPCQVIFRGPYSTNPSLDGGGNNVLVPGTPDLDCLVSCLAAADTPSGTDMIICDAGGALTGTDAVVDAGQTDYTVTYLLVDSNDVIVDNAASPADLSAPANTQIACPVTDEVYTVYTLEYETSQGIAITNNTTTLTTIEDNDGDAIEAFPSADACMDLSTAGLTVTVQAPIIIVPSVTTTCNGTTDFSTTFTICGGSGTYTTVTASSGVLDVSTGDNTTTFTVSGIANNAIVTINVTDDTGTACTGAMNLNTTDCDAVCAPEVGISRQ